MDLTIVNQTVRGYIKRLEKEGFSKSQIATKAKVDRPTLYKIANKETKKTSEFIKTRLEKAFPQLLNKTESDITRDEISKLKDIIIDLQSQLLKANKKMDLNKSIEEYTAERDQIKKELDDYREVLEKKKRVEDKNNSN